MSRYRYLLVLCFILFTKFAIAAPIKRGDCELVMTLTTSKDMPVTGHMDQILIKDSYTPKYLSILQYPLHGTIIPNSSGLLVYQPNDDYVGIDTLVCLVEDVQHIRKKVWTRVYVEEQPSTQGTEFWCSYMENALLGEHPSTKITIATSLKTDVCIQNPKTGWRRVYSLPADTSFTTEVPKSEAYMTESEVIMNKGVQVISSEPITVYAANYEDASFDATNVLPTQSLGSEYMIQTFPGMEGESLLTGYYLWPPEFEVVALEDNTTIEITPTAGLSNGQAGKKIYTLHRGETMLCKSFTTDALTGSEIKAFDKKVAVFTGNKCVYVPLNAACACDHLFEQVIPNNTLGKNFIVSPSVSRVWDWVLITALYDNTEVILDGLSISTLNAHQTDTIVIYNDAPAHYIRTSKASSCFLYISSHCLPGENCLDPHAGTNGDPSMVYIPSFEQRAHYSLFSTYEETLPMNHYVNITTPTNSVDSMCLDGVSIASLFTKVPSLDSMSFARVPVSHGTHRLMNNAGGFIATAYGLIDYESYAYNVASQYVNLWDTIIIIKDTICPGQHYYFQGAYYSQTGHYESMQSWNDTVYQLDLLVTEARYDTTEHVVACERSTYMWHGKQYTTAGLYTDTLIAVTGCDSITHLDLSFHPVLKTYTYDTICDGEQYQWNGRTYTTAVQDQITLTSTDGCDSICHLDLAIKEKTYNSTKVTLCIGDSISWNGKIYRSAGVFNDTILNKSGCDSILQITVTTKDCTDPGGGGGIGGDIPLNPMPFLPITDSIDSVICLGDTILWREMKLYEEGVYRDTGYYWFGWDSVYWVMNLTTKDCDTGSLTIIQTLEHMDYDTLQANPYLWEFNQKTYTEPGFYADTIIEDKDTTIGQLLLTVDYTRTIYSCEGQKVDSIETPWGKFGFDTCTCLTGCLMQTIDSFCIVDAQLCVVYLTADTVREDTTLCYGTSIEWHGIKIDQTKEYEFHEPYTGPIACDSVVFYLNATVKDEPQEKPTVDAVCAGETYTWTTYHDSIITGPGTYYDTLKTADLKCDSIHYTLTLTHKAHSKGDTTAYVCYYDLPYIWHGDIAQDSSIWMTQNAVGCDSTVYLHLVVSPEPKSEETDSTICKGDMIEWHQQQITMAGTYYDTACITIGNGTKCDSIWYTLNVKVQKSDTTKNNVSICAGCQYTWKRDGKPDRIITDEGEYWDTVRYVSTQCDSLIYYLKLKVEEINRDSINDVTCEGTPYIWRGQSLTEEGIYRDTARAATPTECDTVYTLNLTVNSHTKCDTTAYVCYYDLPYIWHGDIAQDSSTWMTKNAAGCDSTVYLHLVVSPEPKSVDADSTICQGDMIEWHQQQITTAGTYHDTARVTMGNGQQCDSIWYSLNVKVLQVLPDSISKDTICYGGDVDWRDFHLTDVRASVVLKDTIYYTKPHCDSLRFEHSIHVCAKAIDKQEEDTTTCYNGDVTWRKFNLHNLQKDTTLRDTAWYVGTQCDSIHYERTIRVLAQAKDDVTEEYTCYGSDVEWRGQKLMNVTANQTLTDKVSYVGTTCDSIRYEHTVYVLKADTVSEDVTICEGSKYIWKRDGKPDSIVAKAGTYYDTLYYFIGCDSLIYRLKLKIGDLQERQENAFACEGSTYTEWKREIVVPAKDSVYTDTVRSATPDACDTVYILNMTVLHKTLGDTTAYVCDGSTFYWRGQIAHDGDKITLTNVAGCDSIVTLKLVELTSSNKQDEDTTICYGESVYWRGKVWTNLTKDSTLTDTIKHKLNTQCDSICFKRIVHVREKAKDDITSETVCYGGDVTWRGQTVTNITTEQTLYDKDYYQGTTCDSVLLTHTIYVKDCGCPDTIHRHTTVNMCDTLLPYTWHTYRDIQVDGDTLRTDTLWTKSGCDSIIYFLDLSTYPCCRPLAGDMEVRDICADEPVMDVIVKMTSGHFTSYRVRYINAEGNTMPFRDTLVATAPQEQDGHVLITLPVPHDAADKTKYPRPDAYTVAITVFDDCGDSLQLAPQTFNVLYPSWLLDQHWDDVIAILNDRYNGGYTFSRIEWLRDGEVLAGEDELYIYLPHQLWNNDKDQRQYYQYQALLTRADDGKTILSCPMVPYHKDSTNVLTEPYVAVTPTLVPKENPVVHVQTNTEGTYWVYDPTGKLLQTADYEPCEHNVFDIRLYNVQTMYILVFTPRNETRPLQEKYRVVKVLVE